MRDLVINTPIKGSCVIISTQNLSNSENEVFISDGKVILLQKIASMPQVSQVSIDKFLMLEEQRDFTTSSQSTPLFEKGKT